MIKLVHINFSKLVLLLLRIIILEHIDITIKHATVHAVQHFNQFPSFIMSYCKQMIVRNGRYTIDFPKNQIVP